MSDTENCAKRRKVVIAFTPFLAFVILTYSGYGALICLQTSINIKGGVGAWSTTAAHITAGIFGLVCVPAAIKKTTIKKMLIFSTMTHFIYILLNFYPVPYLLIPAGILVGMGSSTMWPAMMVYVAHFARRFAKFSSKQTAEIITEFTGYFFCTFQISQTLGNLLSYAILYSGKTITEGNFNNRSILDLSVCGANDCQNPNVTNANLNQYVPQTKSVLYAMIGVMAGLVLVAVGILVFIMPKIDPTLELALAPESHVSSVCDTVHVGTQGVFSAEGRESNNNEEGTLKFMRRTLLETMKHIVNPKQLLITPFVIYSGVYEAYVFAELPRAFVSCMLDVSQVGLCLAVAYTCNALVSYFFGILTNKYGRNKPFLAVALFNIGIYIFLLLWVPTPTTTWLVYVISAFSGCVEGVWIPQINSLHGTMFPESQKKAYVIWNFYLAIGIAVQLGWSTSLCVFIKLYIQISLLCFSLICYGICEVRYKTRHQ
ncbi:protein unc-93 homolog A-like isoform X1 [Ciona intestinalis]